MRILVVSDNLWFLVYTNIVEQFLRVKATVASSVIDGINPMVWHDDSLFIMSEKWKIVFTTDLHCEKIATTCNIFESCYVQVYTLYHGRNFNQPSSDCRSRILVSFLLLPTTFVTLLSCSIVYHFVVGTNELMMTLTLTTTTTMVMNVFSTQNRSRYNISNFVVLKDC